MKWFFEYPDWQKWLPKSPHRIEVENCANCEYSEGGCKYIPQNLCQKHYNLWRCASWTRQLTPCRLRGTDWQEYPKRIIKEMQRLLKPKEMAKVVELDLFDGGAV